MEATFYTWGKRLNSTRVPSGGASYSIRLKDNCSASRPSIRLLWESGNPTSYNMCSIPAFGQRYYWIDNWEWEDRGWVAHCRCDVLATYKDAIGAMTKYVLRSASQYDTNVVDQMYPALMPPVSSRNSLSFSFAHSMSGGSLIVGVVGQGNSTTTGGAGYYKLTTQSLQNLYSSCFSNAESIWPSTPSVIPDFGSALENFGKLIQKAIFNPAQFVTSVMWVPWSVSTGGGTNIRLGWINTGVAGAPVNDPITHLGGTQTVGIYHDTTNRPDAWMEMSPFKRYRLVAPPFGTFELDSSVMAKSSELAIDVWADALSGMATLTATPNLGGGANPPVLVQASAQVGINIGFSGVSSNVMRGASAAAGAITGAAASGLAAVSPFAAGAAAIGSAIIGSAPEVVGNGGFSGGLSALQAPAYVETIEYGVPELDIVGHGRPLMKRVQISSLSGYVLCSDGDCNQAATATDEELAEISRFLTTGFFYE